MTNPAKPKVLSSALGATPTDVVLNGNTAIVGYANDTSELWDLTNPASPQSLGLIQNVGGKLFVFNGSLLFSSGALAGVPGSALGGLHAALLAPLTIPCNGVSVRPTADVFINNTQTNADDITVLNPPQSIPAQFVLHTQTGCPSQTVTFSATPPGRVTLSQTSASLGDGASATISVTPVAVSQSVDDVTITASLSGVQIGSGMMTVADVKIPGVRNSDTPAGMADRIPPRINTQVSIAVAPNLGSSAQIVHLIPRNNSATNGDFTINGTTYQDITTTTNVTLVGTTQTQANPVAAGIGTLCTNSPGGGNSGKLNLVAQAHGQDAVVSSGFSVAAIPLNWTETYVGSINYGLVVQDGWSSDSGDVGDLDQVCITEEVQVGPNPSGVLQNLGAGQNSDYLIGNQFTTDTHGTPPQYVVNPGGFQEVEQTSAFEDFRTGAVAIPMANTGYQVTRTVFLDATTNAWRITTSKVGAATSAKGIASGAGQPSVPISVTQP